MTVRIGMIGPGGMGQAHIDRIHTVIAGGLVVAVSDVNPDNVRRCRAHQWRRLRHLGRAHREPRRRRRDDLQLRSGPRGRRARLHRRRQAGLLREAADPHRRRRAADHGGRAGRRPPPGHRGLHAPLRRQLPGDEGPARLRRARRDPHGALRPPNPTVPDNYTWDMAINDTAIHEVDTMRWLLGEEFVSARVDTPKKTSLRPPTCRTRWCSSSPARPACGSTTRSSSTASSATTSAARRSPSAAP